MRRNSLECGVFNCGVTQGGSNLAEKMCRLIILVTIFAMNIHASSQIPPRLSFCRDIHKSRGPENYTFDADVSCGDTVDLPVVDRTVNFTDHRNCENYLVCNYYTCMQCPCPDGQTFNPVTLMCDNTNAPCVCPVATTTTTTTTTTPTTTIRVTEATTTTKKQLIENDAGADKLNGDNSIHDKPPVSSEVIIIAGIVSATVIVIVVIVMGVFCWQRRHSNQLNSPINKPPPSTSKKISTPNHDAYSSSIPPTEKHEYAEIDERMINGRKHWQHGGSMRAPPLPNHQPPTTSPMFTGMCPHHPRSDSGLGSADTSFTANYPRRTFQPINPAHNIQIGVAYNERPAMCCNCEEPYHGREDSSASSESHYSNSSNPISVDSRDVDMKTPLHSGKQHYMSKQVYI